MRAWVFVFVAIGCAGRAPAPVAPAAPRPAEALAPMRFFLGEWEGRSRAATGGENTLRWSVAPVLGGTWLEGRARLVEPGLEAIDYIAASPSGLVRIYLDSQGTRAMLASPGWKGARLRWEGEGHAADGTPLRARETIERTGDDTMRARWEIDTDGTWQPVSEETLRRVKPRATPRGPGRRARRPASAPRAPRARDAPG